MAMSHPFPRRLTSARGAPKLRDLAGILALATLLAVASPALALAQPERAAPAEHGHESAAGEAHGESVWAFLARLANFAILAGGLYYLLRRPTAGYLDARSQQIRSDLDYAAQTRTDASARLREIGERLKALPGELEAMRSRGREEAAAEEARLKRVAEAERQRLVEQTRREIDRQLQLARRDLTGHAADLAVAVARTRLTHELTDPALQARLVDRYVSQVGGRDE
jgi:F-type H+-transporting ATPase subunit b